MLKKIGVLDSGIGGLTILQDLLAANFNAEYLYISDAKNVPYGEKSQEFMLERITIMVEKLILKGVDSILIACNTATAETIEKIRAHFPAITFIGIEPYINYINHDKENLDHKYALILTRATFKSERFQKLRSTLDPKNHIDIYPLKNLAMLIESLKTNSFLAIQNSVDEEISILKDKGYTHLILGCTHYPIIDQYLRDKLKLKTVNPSNKIIERVKTKLALEVIASLKNTFMYNENADDIWENKSLDQFEFLNKDT